MGCRGNGSCQHMLPLSGRAAFGPWLLLEIISEGVEKRPAAYGLCVLEAGMMARWGLGKARLL